MGTRVNLTDRCSHGRSFSDPCPHCDLIWYEDMLKRAEEYRQRAEVGIALAQARIIALAEQK